MANSRECCLIHATSAKEASVKGSSLDDHSIPFKVVDVGSIQAMEVEDKPMGFMEVSVPEGDMAVVPYLIRATIVKARIDWGDMQVPYSDGGGSSLNKLVNQSCLEDTHTIIA